MSIEEPPLQPVAAAAGLLPCGYCEMKDLGDAMKFCPHCGYPMAGTKEEKEGFVGERLLVTFRGQINAERVRRARNALYWVAALNMVSFLLTKQPAMIVTGLVVSLIFLGLALWTRHEPFPAILTALAFYVLLILLAAIEDPINLVRGIVVKVIALSALFYALRELQQPMPERRAR